MELPGSSESTEVDVLSGSGSVVSDASSPNEEVEPLTEGSAPSEAGPVAQAPQSKNWTVTQKRTFMADTGLDARRPPAFRTSRGE